RRWTFQYDTNRLLTTMTSPIGCTTKFTYASSSGGLASIEDPRGYVTSYTYTGNNVRTMALGAAVWTYTYNNNQTVMQTPTGALTTYNYLTDGTGQLSTEVRPEGYTITYGYTTNRMLVSKLAPYGSIMSILYNTSTWQVTA